VIPQTFVAWFAHRMSNKLQTKVPLSKSPGVDLSEASRREVRKHLPLEVQRGTAYFSLAPEAVAISGAAYFGVSISKQKY
jgi:hypothetical protein